MELKHLLETVAEAAAVDDQRLVLRRQGMHDGGLHGGGAGAGQEHDPGAGGGFGKFQNQLLVFQHDGGKLGRAEIGHLLGADGADLL